MPNGESLRNPLEKLSFNSLFDASAEALLLADSDGHILMSNHVAQELFGYSNEELLKLQVEMLIPQRLREHHRRYRESYAQCPEKRSMGRGRDLVALKRDGSELQVDIGLSPIREGEQLYILISFFDATQSRQAQRALQLFERVLGRRWPSLMRWHDFPLLSGRFEDLAMRMPYVDVIDRDTEIVVRAEVPGIDKKDLDISLSDNLLTIKGQTQTEKKEEKGGNNDE